MRPPLRYLVADDVTTAVLADGTTVKIARSPDPIWGMKAPSTTTTTTTPSGLQRVQTTSRTATASASDPAVVTSETVTQTVNGKSTRTAYDGTQRKYTTTTPVGRTFARYVDANNRTTRLERPSIAALVYGYDADGRLSTITQGTRVTSRSYYTATDATHGYPASLTNALTQTISFVPDALGRTLAQSVGGSTTGFTWDGENNLTSVTPPSKPVHVQTYTATNLLSDYLPPAAGLPVFGTHYDYDLDRNLTLTTRPDAVAINRSYDTAGRLDLLTMPTGALDYAYYAPGCTTAGCAAGKIASIAGPGGVSLGYGYDGQLLKTMGWSGAVNGTVSWTYDADFRRITETVQAPVGSAAAFFGYDNDSLLTCASPTTCNPAGADALKITRNNQNALLTGTALANVTDAYTYNTYGELATYQARYSTTTLYSVVYDAAGAPRDALGRVAQKTETLGGTTRVYGYTYDVQGRLTDVRQDGTLREHYEYDPNGNRILGTVEGSTVVPTYDGQDRLLTYGDRTYTYTANGELSAKTGPEGTTSYGYDAMGSLISVNLPDGRLVEYMTDGVGRRVGKKIDGVIVKRWLYRDQLKPVAELDGSGNLVAEFVYGTKANVPDYVVRGGATYRVVSDQLGSPVLAVNVANSADVPFQATYEAFGKVTAAGGGALDWMPFGFAGGMYDQDTGLVRFGARDYDPETGRWTAKDSTRFSGDGTNLYVYAGGSPTNLTDRTGYSDDEPSPAITGCTVCKIHCSVEVARCYDMCDTVPDKGTCIAAMCSYSECVRDKCPSCPSSQPPAPPPDDDDDDDFCLNNAW